LVTELQNQDPTASTDPNEYVNQLVSVNSLEQLININQTVSSALASKTASSSGSGGATQAVTHNPLTAAQNTAADAATGSAAAVSNAAAIKSVPGNLSIPDANPAAQRVASALSGRPRIQ
jgi:flagellar basal-body rod modification protein FlgD